ncbi:MULTISPECIES: hypothetical protein [Burkholderia]|uniref:Uncharacterized protein n=1 Tax=Burkholderia pyrrocinia TaxID=60550 RepID=A0A318JJQ6_BURPY|nr:MULTISPECIES: hypothetical protein [Burkholderia]PXX40472.1 hypothetical protein NA66_100182 [Burkholderia pyrrocinia]SFW27255.1 hypothetical protein SAMN03159384_00915 [Burkholderia sp. NFACC33-1]SFX41712.1 hypothetical protein SAMN03159408_01280 [Burkholderia sp. NFPP32]
MKTKIDQAVLARGACAARVAAPTDGKRILLAQYKVTGCNGPYEGVTDETGRGVMYRCKTQSKIDVSFYQSRP